MLFTLATLLEVTSGGSGRAQQSNSAAAAPIAAATDKDETEDGKDSKGDDDDDDATKFLQPVRVGDLIGRAVIAPLESQDLLGHVAKLVRHDDDITVVISAGGHFGLGTHLVCVPPDALALTGTALQLKGISPDDLAKLPPCDGSGDSMIGPSAVIKMKLAKPAH